MLLFGFLHWQLVCCIQLLAIGAKKGKRKGLTTSLMFVLPLPQISKFGLSRGFPVLCWIRLVRRTQLEPSTTEGCRKFLLHSSHSWLFSVMVITSDW